MCDPKDPSARSEHTRDVLEHIHTLDTTRYVFVFTKKKSTSWETDLLFPLFYYFVYYQIIVN